MSDKSEWVQTLMRLHDEGKISTKKIAEAVGLDYQKEVDQIREIKREQDET